ncbi:uncharacterized protein MELLADRAFT_78214 [Melampsora larici-populina 98AG31]|uniref:Uncharacterized protein n=1 Tax=Melampsora larici-populina (strain 98AG31 / pathotype 3-4-7) TaxID=747676 RepID=F4RRL1_MELLP|nr:uncharacterized protein MELLADRAFT_78214 [Melampsora larici-populina 98AG31]EGG05005.1 hypothetical protein MELLADRAFT_78214 [Melampsora larici-populina 98AG31]
MSRQNQLRTTNHQHELPPIRTLTTTATTTTTTTTSPQSNQTQLSHSNQSINLANDPLSQDYKEVEAHLANSLPDFLVSSTSNSDDLSRKRKLASLGAWDLNHFNAKRMSPTQPNTNHGFSNPSGTTTEPNQFSEHNSESTFDHHNLTSHPTAVNPLRSSTEPVPQHHLSETSSRPPQGPDAVASLLTAYLNNPVNPVIGQNTPLSRISPLAQVAAFGSNENVRQAVLCGLAQSQTNETPSWAKERPTKLEGPFLCIPQSTEDPIKSKQVPLIYGPVDPSLLDPQTVIAVYYACYASDSTTTSSDFKFDLEVLDPVLGGTPLVPPSASTSVPVSVVPSTLNNSTPPVKTKNPHTHKRNSVPSMSREQIIEEAASGVDPFKVPEVDMSARKRAPRKCGVCGQYYCKGRGNRTLCPSYIQGRDDSPTQPPRYDRLGENESSPHLPAIPMAVNITSSSHRTNHSPHLLGDRYNNDIRVNDTMNHESPITHHIEGRSGGTSSSISAPPAWSFMNSDKPMSSIQQVDDGNRNESKDEGLVEESSNRRHSSSGTGTGGVGLPSTSSSENVRKRGPRRCAVCQLMNCPGNGNRKLCSNRPNQSLNDGVVGSTNSPDCKFEPQQV